LACAMSEAPGGTLSGLVLSAPLYSWDAGPDQRLSFDVLHNRVIHYQETGFFVIDVNESGKEGSFVKFTRPNLRSVAFSPDRNYFAFLSEQNFVGIAETGDPNRGVLNVPFRSTPAGNAEVLSFFWAPARHPVVEDEIHQGSFDLAVITSTAVEMFVLSPASFTLTGSKRFQLSPPATKCWVEPKSGISVLMVGSRTLQPFILNGSAPTKMCKFDCCVDREVSIGDTDVAVMRIYDSTYCVHTDAATGRVSLRNLSNVAMGTPEHDIVLDLQGPGALRMSKVDNLLVIHGLDQGLSWIFDIQQTPNGQVSGGPLCSPSPVVAPHYAGKVDVYAAGWHYLCVDVIMDFDKGSVFRLQLDLDLILKDLLVSKVYDVMAVVHILLRRASCRNRIVSTLLTVLQQEQSEQLPAIFDVLNSAYRGVITRTTEQRDSRPRKSLVGWTAKDGNSILSSHHMVNLVFYPHFISQHPEAQATAAEADGDDELALPPELAPDSSMSEEMKAVRIPPPKDSAPKGPWPRKCPPFLVAVCGYLRSMINLNIEPQKILQCFVFDLCIWFRQEHALQQLMHYHVLMDSPEICGRLFAVVTRPRCEWTIQSCLDMSKRVGAFAVTGAILIHLKQYVDVIPCWRTNGVTSFPVSFLLERIDRDRSRGLCSEETWEYILEDLRMWISDAKASDGFAGDPGRRLGTPDVSGCVKWLPDLEAT